MSLLATLRQTTFRSLRHRDYRLYFAGQAVSFTGSWVQSTALLWSVYALTADPAWPPLMLAATVGPTLLFGPVGGSLADRFPKRRLILACQVFFLLNAVALAALVWWGWAVPGVVLGLQMLNGVVQAVDLPARLAFVPELVSNEDLVNAFGLNSLLFNLGRAVGPAVAGLVFVACGWVGGTDAVTRVGATACFVLNAVSYAGVIFGLTQMKPTPPTARKVPGRLADGFRFVGKHPHLAALLACTAAISLFGWPLLTLFPAYTVTVLHHQEAEYSWLVSSLGGGALLAALANATFGSLARARPFVVIGSALTAAGVLTMATTVAFPVAAVGAAVFGFGMIFYLSTGQSVLQLSTPDDARGRVMALWPMTLSGGSVAGNLLGGWAARTFPVPAVLLVMAGGVSVTAAVVAALAWRVRR